MTAIITEVAAEPEVKTFIRQAWSARHGMTRERNLYESIKKTVKNKTQAIEYAKELVKTAPIYAGLGNPASELWEDYDSAVRQSIEVLHQLGVTQLRPLLLAVFQHFKVDEVTKTLPMIVAWTVRFLICGSGGSGTLEAAYADRAKDVSSGTVKTAKTLYEAMKTVLPDDQTFEDKFAQATVSNSNLAKYYLRVLEQHAKADGDELVVNPDSGKVNLEHIMPKGRAAAWAAVAEDQHRAMLKRLGNLTLLASRLNAKAANANFEEKKKHFAKSTIGMTKNLCTLAEWTPAEIEARQRALAKLAVVAWSSKAR